MSYTVSILIEAVDRASGVFRALSNALGGFSLELGVVQGAVAGLATAIVTELVDAMERAIEVAMECAEAYAQYEWVLVRVATATGALGEQARALTGQFEELTRSVGVEFGVGATGAAEALESLVKAGLEGEEATKALEATLTLAQIELMDTGEAADYVAAILRAFSLSADQAAHVVDVLVNASIKGIATAREFAYALSYCSGIAAQMGLSLEETVAALVAMNNQGIEATYAGRYLMRMLQDLIEHSDKLGFSIYDASGRLLSLSEIIARLEAHLAQFSTDEERAAYLTEIFGTQGMRAALALLNASYAGLEGSEALRALTEALGEAGTASVILEEQMNTLAGTMARARARIQDAMIATGEALAPAVDVATEAFSKLVQYIAKAVAPFIAKLSELMAKLLALFERIAEEATPLLEEAGELLYEMFSDVCDVLITLLDAIMENEWAVKALAYALVGLVIALNPLLAALTALAAIYKLIKDNADKLMPVFEAIKRAFLTVKEVATKLFTTISNGVQVLYNTIMPILQALWSFIVEWLTPALNVLRAVGEAAWAVLRLSIALFWSIAEPILTSLYEVIMAVLIPAIQLLQATWQAAWNAIQVAVSVAWSIIKPVVDALLSAIEAIRQGIEELKSWFQGACDAVSGFFQSIADAANSLYQQLVGGSIWPEMLKKMARLLDRYLGIMENSFADTLKRMREQLEEFEEETVGGSIWPETFELMYAQAEHYLGRVEKLFVAWNRRVGLTPLIGAGEVPVASTPASITIHVHVGQFTARRPEDIEFLAREITRQIARELRLRGVYVA